MTGQRGRNNAHEGPSSRASSAHSARSTHSQPRSSSRASRASRAPSHATNAGSQASSNNQGRRQRKQKIRDRQVIVPRQTDEQIKKKEEVQKKMEQLINDITKKVSDEYVRKHIEAKHKYDPELKQVVPYPEEEKRELQKNYDNKVAECDGHWLAAKISDGYDTMSAKEKSTFDNYWRSEKRKQISTWLREHKIPPLLNKLQLRAYVQKMIMESQKEMENSADMIDKLKNKVFENLERKVVVQRPETHVFDLAKMPKGKEPNATEMTESDIKSEMAMPDLLEQRMSQQVLSALRYL
jgi:hypothetical protein